MECSLVAQTVLKVCSLADTMYALDAQNKAPLQRAQLTALYADCQARAMQAGYTTQFMSVEQRRDLVRVLNNSCPLAPIAEQTKEEAPAPAVPVAAPAAVPVAAPAAVPVAAPAAVPVAAPVAVPVAAPAAVPVAAPVAVPVAAPAPEVVAPAAPVAAPVTVVVTPTAEVANAAAAPPQIVVQPAAVTTINTPNNETPASTITVLDTAAPATSSVGQSNVAIVETPANNAPASAVTIADNGAVTVTPQIETLQSVNNATGEIATFRKFRY